MVNSETYWYEADADSVRGRRVLEALRAYQATEIAMRRRSRQAMSKGENEMLVLRFVIRARGRGETVTPGQIARHLGITTASTTALIDRLERSGHLARAPHPTDRRSVVVTSTARTDEEIRATLGDMHEQMMTATQGMTDAQADDIVAFLERMRLAVDSVAPPDPYEE